jgi:hypothetical protein
LADVVALPVAVKRAPSTDIALTAQAIPRPEVKVDAIPLATVDTLTLPDCVRMFEEAIEASQTARELSERDRDFYDGKQITEAEASELKKRGQPEVVLNMMRQKINFLIGLEKQQRTKPKAMPRTPVHENDAHACSDALKYVVDKEEYQKIRSRIWKNMLVEGSAACCVTVAPKPDGTGMDVKLRYYAWDRFFADPHSSHEDFSDAGYLGTVLWMDESDALAMYGADAQDAIDVTLTSAVESTTYDDKPAWTIWADRKRKRIRVVQMWIKRAGEWYFAEFTKGGFLKTGPSPYVNEEGRTDCEIIAQSAYVDRENNRYGEAREMISPQEEINKRRSKSLHILNTSQVVTEEGAVIDEERARREAARPDGWITLNPGMSDKFRFETKGEMANGQFKLLEHTMNVFQLMGANAAMQGNAGDEASGRAILASQQGGMIQTASILDNLRDFDVRIYKTIWNRIRQYWDGPMWVRVTDDERNIRFVGINGAPDPLTGQPGVPVSQLDVDIVIDDAPDGVAPQIEQFQALAELKKFDTEGELTFRTLMKAMPNLRNKDQILDEMDQRRAELQQMQAQQGPPPEIALKMAEMEAERAQAQQQMELDQAKAMAADNLAKQRAATERDIAMLRLQIEDDAAESKARREWAVAQAKIELQREQNAAKAQTEAAKVAASDDSGSGDDEGDKSAETAAALQFMVQEVQDLKLYAESAKQLVRDENGQATYVRSGLGLHPVIRDAQGRATGLGPVIQEGND